MRILGNYGGKNMPDSCWPSRPLLVVVLEVLAQLKVLCCTVCGVDMPLLNMIYRACIDDDSRCGS